MAEHARFHRAVGCSVEQVNAGRIVPGQTVEPDNSPSNGVSVTSRGRQGDG
jgi:hypothetical protein